ncbi:hypothetical protein BDN71DRAFT_1428365 [Pleurotus eryngii]|uniref:Uncharacterized protein n=1 Tax=Pleurotus eryngii TaxID=5323 RepID=A0A9P6A4C1_PLEER|nr:hypothetical protein BDN71DRAFT_1428365 [Pleurotus eryngii]
MLLSSMGEELAAEQEHGSVLPPQAMRQAPYSHPHWQLISVMELEAKKQSANCAPMTVNALEVVNAVAELKGMQGLVTTIMCDAVLAEGCRKVKLQAGVRAYWGAVEEVMRVAQGQALQALRQWGQWMYLNGVVPIC